MSYTNQIFNSDLDTFKNPMGYQEGMLSISGTVASNGIFEDNVTFTVDNPDFFLTLFDNSLYHSGKYKDIKLELATLLRDTTTPSYLVANFYTKISGNTITVGAEAFNPYGYSVTIDSVDINIVLVPYQKTF